MDRVFADMAVAAAPWDPADAESLAGSVSAAVARVDTLVDIALS